MEMTLSQRAPIDARVDLLILATSAKTWTADIAPFDRAVQGHLRGAAVRAEFNAADGATLLFQTHGAIAPRLLLIMGVDPALAPRAWHQVADAAIQRGRDAKADRVAVAVGRELATPDAIANLAEGALLADYRFDRFKSEPARRHVTSMQLLVPQADAARRAALQHGRLRGEATCYARDLITTPAAEVTPNYLAAEARRLARSRRLRVRIFDQRALARLGMGAILGVAQGSVQPPRLIELIYRPRGRVRKRIAIVGKGITFDSGGLSLKNPESMQGQKRDMAGGAAVLGVMSVIAELRPPVEVRGFVAAAENMPDARAMKPGDVVRAFNRKTIEVLNTDAEGRLVLADALAYASASKPDAIIDLATLTAAVGAALGRRYAGIMGTDKSVVEQLIAAGARAGENLWQLPLVDEYRSDIVSRVADLKNTGEGYAGTIIGGLFLREFVGQVPWAHIDFSSTVLTDKPFAGHPIGATGFGVRTLLHYITRL
ncbi:MAG TPA: leucyl aminopeptidase [Candidatus Kryptonia bacterium]|nr:leucyl aminopeptidase [Candidatus Kryptonia bacterium]